MEDLPLASEGFVSGEICGLGEGGSFEDYMGVSQYLGLCIMQKRGGPTMRGYAPFRVTDNK